MHSTTDENLLLFSSKFASQKKYWENKLTRDISKTVISLKDRESQQTPGDKREKIDIHIHREIGERIVHLSQNSLLSMYMVLLTALKALVFKYFDNPTPLIISPVYKPKVSDLMINDFVFLSETINRDMSFKELLLVIRKSTLDAYENQDYPAAKLMEFLYPGEEGKNEEGEAGNSQLRTITDILCLLDNIHDKAISLKLKGVVVFSFSYDPEHLLSGYISYDPALCEGVYLEQLAGHLVKILEIAMGDINRRLSAIDLLSDSQKNQLLYEFNNRGGETRDEPPARTTIRELYERQVAGTPDRIAVSAASKEPRAGENHPVPAENPPGQVEITYRELNTKADKLGQALAQRGIRPNAIVALLVDRTVDMCAGIMGILKSGGAYLPLDPEYPRERLTYILEDSSTALLVTEESLYEKLDLKLNRVEIILIDKLENGDANRPARDPGHVPRPLPSILAHDLAYVIYTSGTTGKPKGVLLEHQGVVNLVTGLNRRIYSRYKTGLRTAMLSPYVFDASIKQIFGVLLLGHSLFIVPEAVRSDAFALLVFYRKHGIEVSDGTPIHIRLLWEVIKENRGDSEPRLPVLHFIIGGEELPRKLAEDFFKCFGGGEPGGNKVPVITNVYGPTECCVDTTSYQLDPGNVRDYSHIPLGKPMHNYRVYILDRQKELLPVGVPGELCAAGPGVARGYLNNQTLTQEKFVDDPFVKNKKMYCTGDYARWMTEGNIAFLGRIDQQVKVRGVRIELEEIENLLQSHEIVKQAVVTARAGQEGDKYLCAYIVPRTPGSFNETRLRESLTAELPNYIIPSYFVEIEHLPLTSHGKMDKSALPDPGIESGVTYVAPRDALEKKLAEIWAGVLSIDILNASPGQTRDAAMSIGIDDNFFRLGGHSLKATILAGRIHKTLDINLQLIQIFKSPTIRQLSEYIRMEADRERFAAIKPVEKREYYNQSSAQRRLFVLQRMDEKGVTYNMPSVWQVEGNLDIEKFEVVFQGLIRQHESLRTSFMVLNDEPVQRIHEEAPFKILHHHASGNGPAPALDSFIRPFDLGQAPLLRVDLVEAAGKTGKARNRNGQTFIMVDMHHIISDGISVGILVKDFMEAYAGKQQHALRLQYKDYTQWQHRRGIKKQIKQQEAYWINEFQGEIPLLELPTDYPRPAVQDFDGARLLFEIGAEQTKAIKSLVQEQSITLFMLLLSLYTVCLSRWCTREDIVVGTPTAGRRHADLEPIIGMFVNTLPLRNFPDGQKPFSQYLEEVKENTLKAFENQDYLYEDLVDRVEPVRDTSRNPLFDTVFVLQNFETVKIEVPGLQLKPIGHEAQTAKFDLTLSVVEQLQGLVFVIEYRTKLFKEETIRCFTGYLKKTAAAVIHSPALRIAEIEIIGEEEKNRLLDEFNGTTADYPEHKTIHCLFEEQAERTPSGIALAGQTLAEGVALPAPPPRLAANVQLTYRQLNEQSNRLAALLIGKEVKPGTIVGIMTERSLEMITGIMGILKAGGAYLPIDPEYPKERITYMLLDSGAKMLVTTTKLQDKVKAEVEEEAGQAEGLHLQAINIDKDILYSPGRAPLTSNSDPGLTLTSTCQVRSSDLAYIIYTSGTTGKPKGSLIEHRNVVSLMAHENYLFDFGSHDVWTMFHSYCFDFSVWEMYGALLYGGKLLLIDRMTARDPRRCLQILKAGQVTILNQTPAAFYQLARQELESPGNNLRLKYVIFGGEALTPGRLKTWKDKYPQTKLINMFGITETTVHVTYKEIEPQDIDSNISNIGKAIPTLTVYILDRHHKLLPVGVAGELCIGGKGVSRGYLNRPGLTAGKFLENPILPGQRLYRSGDLGKWAKNGNIEFLGRIDHQVKIRGFRIELGEIENCLMRVSGIKEAVVLARQEETGDKYTCAYFVAQSQYGISQLREHLAKELPDYMIPAYFVQLEKIPLTPNGKLDREALPAPEGISLREETRAAIPTTAVEKKLVEIWGSILGRDNIGINENFFMIGGDSIKSIQIISRLRSSGYTIEMKDLFLYPVIYELAPRVKKLKRIPDQSAVTGTIPLTPIQARFFKENKIDTHHYNQAVLLYSQQGFTKEMIGKIFSKIQEHHDALRMTYKLNVGKGEMVQTSHGPEYPLAIQEYDMKNREHGLNEFKAKLNQIQASIHLEKGPLMKLGLFHLEDGDRLLIALHHLVIDGVSWRILFEDIEMLYNQYKRGENPALPAKTDPYKTWSQKLSAYANSKTFIKEKNYWRQVESLDIPPIPKDFDVEENPVKDMTTISLTLDGKETAKLLTKVNRAFKTEINDILITALGKAIKKTWGHNRVLIAMEGHGRQDIFPGIDISRTVGWFTVIYPLVLDMSYSGDPGRQIKEVKETLRQIPVKGMGYGILKYLTREENKQDIRFKLKPQISFNYLGQFDADIKQRSSFEIAKESPGHSQSLNNEREYLLDIGGMIANNRLTMTISYNRTHFKPGTAAALSGHFKTALKDLIAFCSSREKTEPSPSDFTYKKLSIESVDRIEESYPGLEDIYTLTPMQQGMLYHALADGLSQAYFEQIAYRLQGELDISLVEKSLNHLVKRHDILRTAFVYHDLEQPLQVVLAQNSIEFYYQDLGTIKGKQEKEKYARDFKAKDKERSFDLSKGALMRVAILQIHPAVNEFIWSSHHILMDGWCIGILIHEFLEIYRGKLENRPPRLPEIKPYRTYIQWLENQDKQESGRYWQKYLESFTEQTGVPKTREIKHHENKYKNETLSFPLGIEKTTAMNKLAVQNHVTMNTLIQVLWAILLGKYTGKDDVVFGAVVSGRPPGLEGVESMVGLFINTIPVRIRWGEKMKFHQLLQKVQQEALAGEPHHYYPLVEIQATVPLKQNLIDHLFIFENYPIADQIEGLGEKTKKNNKKSLFKLENVEVFEQTNYDFNIILGASDRIWMTFQYNGNVYESGIVERIFKHFTFAVDRVIENQQMEIGELWLLLEREDEKQLSKAITPGRQEDLQTTEEPPGKLTGTTEAEFDF